MLTLRKLIIFLLVPNRLWFFTLPGTERLLWAWLTRARLLPAPTAESTAAGDGAGLRVGDQGSPNESADPTVTHAPPVALLQCWKQKIDELYNVLLLLLIFLSAAAWCLLEANRPLWPQNDIYSSPAAGGKTCVLALPSDKQASEHASGKGHVWQRYSSTAWKHGSTSVSDFLWRSFTLHL